MSVSEGAGGFGRLFNELRRRNVTKVETVYLIASWILIQIAETTFPALKLPEWTVTFVVVLLALFFPIAVIFAWAFELTPEGLKKTAEVNAETSITETTGRRINYVIIGVLAVAVVVMLATGTWRFGPDAEPSAARSGRQSIAVLPFVNMSDDKQNEYFSDGLSEELLNVLAQVDGLRVAGRTSSFHFKGENQDLRMIGEQLGVEHLLEGSVRKSGNRIRVTAQLVKVDDGFHLWSDTYDYEMSDVFRIQDEISLAVVDALKVELLGQERERLTKRATTNVEAHNLYLRGRQFLHLRTLESIQQAKNLFEQATRMDPGFALAYSGLSDSIQLLSNNHNMMSPEEAVGQSRPLLERAVALDPESAEVWASVGLTEIHARNWEQAETALQKAMQLNPSYAPGYLWYASLLGQKPDADDERAIEIYRKVLTIDPLSRVAQQNIAAGLADLGRYEEAEAEFRRAITLDPDYGGSYLGMANLYSNVYYRLDEAHRWLLKANDLAPLDASVGVNLPGIYITLGMTEEYERWLRRIANDAPEHPITQLLPIWRATVYKDEAELRRGIEALLGTPLEKNPVLQQFECSRMELAGRFDAPLIDMRQSSPELFESPPRVDGFNSGNVQCALHLLQAAGDGEQMAVLLAAAREYAERQIKPRPALDIYLSGLALAAGDDERAVSHLQTAVDGGWVGSLNFGWRVDQAPAWLHLHDRPGFARSVRTLDDKFELQRANIEQQLAERGVGVKF
jgi:TolB-like protein/Flp pilus assembly protein TadD